MQIDKKQKSSTIKSFVATSQPMTYVFEVCPNVLYDSCSIQVNIVFLSNKGMLLLPITCRFIEYKAVITSIPASKGLILNFVCIKPVVEPARSPATNAARLAIRGFAPLAINADAVAAPNVNDPSAVISAKLKTRKLIKIPRANNDSIKPIVNDPTNSDINYGIN